MKHILLLIILACMNNIVFAHGSHGAPTKITSEQAVQIAERMAQKLTLDDFGYSVGKLSKNWLVKSSNKFSITQESDTQFVISAHNDTSNKTIYFEIARNGDILNIR